MPRKAEILIAEDVDAGAPRVEAVISETMKRFPGQSKAALAQYFEEVHQELAPLARELGRENRALQAQLGFGLEGNHPPIDGDRPQPYVWRDTGALETGEVPDAI